LGELVPTQCEITYVNYLTVMHADVARAHDMAQPGCAWAAGVAGERQSCCPLRHSGHGGATPRSTSLRCQAGAPQTRLTRDSPAYPYRKGAALGRGGSGRGSVSRPRPRMGSAGVYFDNVRSPAANLGEVRCRRPCLIDPTLPV
jgi:hypothetical protein